MLKDQTWNKSTSNHISIDELNFVTKLDDQQSKSVSGGYYGYSIGGYYDYSTGRYVTVDYVGAALAGYPTGPIDPRGYMLNQEAQNIYSDLQGIFTHLPSM